MATRSWSARWGNWQVGLRHLGDCWGVKVWRWAPDAPLEDRRVLATCDYFESRDKAVEWACAVMKSDGARVFVLDAPNMTLESVLRFLTAPELAA